MSFYPLAMTAQEYAEEKSICINTKEENTKDQPEPKNTRVLKTATCRKELKTTSTERQPVFMDSEI